MLVHLFIDGLLQFRASTDKIRDFLCKRRPPRSRSLGYFPGSSNFGTASTHESDFTGRYALHEFAKNVYNIRAVDSKDRELKITRPDPYQWNVSGHDGDVKISYTIFGDRSDGTYLAIDNTHAHMNMPATFMWARCLEDRPIQITFRKPNPEWRIATQLIPTEDPETFKVPNFAYFMDSPTEISAFQLHEWQINTDGTMKTIRLAIHHDGTEAEAAAYAELCRAVVAEEIAIFGQAPNFDYGTYIFIADYNNI